MTVAIDRKSSSPQFVEVQIGLIDESPFNHRKVFNGLEELAASIRTNGVLQPGTARANGGRYELIFGHRRLRAAKLAKRPTFPLIVGPMTDAQVLEAQLVENVQREDVHPLEEAEGYRELQEKHGYSVEKLVERTGKSRRWVYDRLKLLALSKEARAAFLERKLDVSRAGLVAQLPAKFQGQALKDVTGSNYRGEPLSFRDAQRELRDKYTVDLKQSGLPFSLKDETLLVSAGACAKCPKLSGNARDEFPDIQGASVCTDRACFDRKLDAAWAIKTGKAKASGWEILTEAQCKRIFQYGHLSSSAPYQALDEKNWNDDKSRPWRECLGRAKVTYLPVLARHPETRWPVELVDKSVLRQLEKTETPANIRAGASPDRQQQETLKVRRLLGAMALAILVQKIEAKEPTEAWWHLLVEGVIDHSDHDTLVHVRKRRGLEEEHTRGQGLVKASKTMKTPALRALAFELLATRGLYFTWSSGYPEAFKGGCQLFGIDLKKLETDAKAQLKKKPAKKTPAKKK